MEDLQTAPFEYNQIFIKNIEIQNKALGLLRALFFVDKDFKKGFVEKLKFELGPNRICEFRPLFTALKARKATFEGLKLFSATSFQEIFGFINPITRVRRRQANDNDKLFLRATSHKTNEVNSSFKADQTRASKVSNSLLSKSFNKNSIFEARPDKFKILNKTQKFSLNPAKNPGMFESFYSTTHTKPKHASVLASATTKKRVIIETSNALAETNDPPEKTSNFFYRLKDKVRQPSLVLKEETKNDSVTIKKSRIEESKAKNSFIEINEEFVKPRQVNFVNSSKQSMNSTLNNIETPSKTNNFKFNANKEWNAESQARFSVNSFELPPFVENSTYEHRQFITAQIILNILLDYLSDSSIDFFTTLGDAYDTMESEAIAHFETHSFLMQLYNIKSNLIKRLKKSVGEKNLNNGRNGKESEEDMINTSHIDSFFQEKTNKLHIITSQNVKKLNGINLLHSFVLKICNLSQSLASVNKINIQLILVEKISTDKKFILEKKSVDEEIKSIELKTRINHFDPSFNLPETLRTQIQFLSSDLKEIVPSLICKMDLLKNFGHKEIIIKARVNGHFDLYEFSRLTLDRLFKISSNFIKIYKSKFLILQAYMFSAERFLNSRNPNIAQKHRKKLLFNIDKHSNLEHVFSNRQRREKFNIIINNANKLPSQMSLSLKPKLEEKDNDRDKENFEGLGKRFLRNTEQDNSLVKSHYESIIDEHNMSKNLNIRKGKVLADKLRSIIDRSSLFLPKEMSFNFQVLQKLKQSNIKRSDQGTSEKTAANR